MIHALKCWPGDFEAISRGSKTHEARHNDRNFAVGDSLRLREWKPKSPDACHWNDAGRTNLPGDYTGRELDVRVTHITQGRYGLPERLAIMSIEHVEMGTDDKCPCSLTHQNTSGMRRCGSKWGPMSDKFNCPECTALNGMFPMSR